ncbi:hypothetical protein A1O1_07935 [Capronia coronata CBS 617.96]|uniref:F-box domain-containing protein n=1 Tax=Capronia coronata CBS 617.96 TaxID=1182541 RepID=W9XX08_9EURO|nr:uncharacterized protein A1O1_07935 [Capronia coronata CBS 617.96]EXJ81870.1 hypothetical protein A1O1_07935 [Capronia coronata CBS 617.96]
MKRVRYHLNEPKINSSIFKSKQVAQQNTFFKLPLEVTHHIWKLLPTVADRLSLALTCKENAAMFEATKAIKLRDGIHYYFPKPLRTTRVHRLQVLTRLQSWVPRNLRLCYRCVQYIDLLHPDNRGQWGGDTKIVTDGLATAKAMREGPRCALCIMADKFELAKHKKAYQEVLRLTWNLD